MIQQGDIYWIDLGTPIGSEPAYLHPYVVIQINILNRSRIQTVIVLEKYLVNTPVEGSGE